MVGKMISRMTRACTLGRNHRCGRIRAHAAGVGPGVAVAEAFVILTGCKRNDVFAVGHDDEARFFALEKLLDDDPCARGAQFVFGEDRVDRCMRLFACGGDNHAFACRQTICLDDDRCALRIDVAYAPAPTR